MKNRRFFIKGILAGWAGLSLLALAGVNVVKVGFGAVKKTVLKKGTDLKSIIHRNPADLDTSELDPTNLKDFSTMGVTQYKVDMEKWQLRVTGAVRQPLTLKYADLLALPVIEKNVLLICPGVFAQLGHWKGVSVGDLLKRAGVELNTGWVEFSGPAGAVNSRKSFAIDQLENDQVFLAYAVNGQTLPVKHGFPLRVVAEGSYGANWIKYVNQVSVEKATK